MRRSLNLILTGEGAAGDEKEGQQQMMASGFGFELVSDSVLPSDPANARIHELGRVSRVPVIADAI